MPLRFKILIQLNRDSVLLLSEWEHRAPKRRAKLPQPRTSYEHMIKLVLISFYVDLTRKDV